MNNTSAVRRTNLEDFVRDLISLIQEQIELAKADPGIHQKGAISVCGDTVSIIRLRLEDDKILLTKCALVCLVIFNAHWRSEWDALANASPDKFSIEADKLLEDTRRISFILTHSEQSSA